MSLFVVGWGYWQASAALVLFATLYWGGLVLLLISYWARELVTEHKEQEAELRRSQRFIQQVADTMPAILFVYDLGEPHLVYVNRQLVDSLGYTPSSYRGASVG